MEPTDNFAFLLPFIFLVFGTAFLVAATRAGSSYRWWGFGYICAAFGFALPILLAGLPDFVGDLISNVLFLIAFFSYGQALLSRFGRPRLRREMAALALFGFLAILYFVLAAPDLRSELAAGDICLALLLAVPLVSIRAQVRRPMDRLLVLMVAVVLVETVARVSSLMLLTASGTYPTLDAFFASNYAFVMQVGASVIGFLLALVILCSAMVDVIGQHRHAAERDPLTDQLNRRGFERLMPDFNGEQVPSGSVIVGDIDHFKGVNDEFGHAAGDRVIIAFSAALQEALPDGVLIARFGGEEFVAFLPEITLGEAERLANLARGAFERREWPGTGIDRRITASFGISAVARGDHSIHDTIKRADACLYAAKSAGRNQVVAEGQRGQPAAATTLRIVPKP